MIINADCVEAMQAMEPDSVDAIVCDPPYGLEFMGREWDRLGATNEAASDSPGWRAGHGGSGSASQTNGVPFGGGGQRVRYGASAKTMQEWHQAWATEALRVLKPGGHLLAFGGTRTYHRLACAVEDAGFEIRDSLIWIYGSGFPKSLNLNGDHQGWGTALKPAHEPIVVARKPLVGTVAANVLEHGTGALNIDGCRIGMREEHYLRRGATTGSGMGYHGAGPQEVTEGGEGRWPPNVTLSHLPECKQTGTRKVKGHPGYPNGPGGKSMHYSDQDSRGDEVRPEPWQGHADSDGTETVPAYSCAPGCPVAELDRQSGERPGASSNSNGLTAWFGGEASETASGYGDTGGASRFFYVAKASRAERNAGLDGFEEREATNPYANGEGMSGRSLREGEWVNTEAERKPRANVHPTVKPIALMRWLVRLVTPKGGTVLDPFTGSGSTGVAAVLEGFDFVGIEREAEYVALAEARVKFWAQFPGADVDKVLLSDARAREIEASGQMGLL